MAKKIAVLVGDYLLSKGLLLAVDKSQFDLLRLVSNPVREMSEGELLQMEKARRLDIEEDVYYDIIRKKTATLISACCACARVRLRGVERVCEVCAVRWRGRLSICARLACWSSHALPCLLLCLYTPALAARRVKWNLGQLV